MSEYKTALEYEKAKLDKAENCDIHLKQRHADYLVSKKTIEDSNVPEGLKHLRIYRLAIQCSEPVPVQTEEFLFNAFHEIELIQKSGSKHKPQKQIQQLEITGGPKERHFSNATDQKTPLGQQRAICFFRMVSEGVEIDTANNKTAEKYGVEPRQIRTDRKHYAEAEDYVRGEHAAQQFIDEQS